MFPIGIEKIDDLLIKDPQFAKDFVAVFLSPSAEMTVISRKSRLYEIIKSRFKPSPDGSSYQIEGDGVGKFADAFAASSTDAAMNAHVQDFMWNYDGSIYYPSGGLDLKSVINLAVRFPKVSHFTFVDTLNISENAALGAFVSVWPHELSKRAELIQRILSNNFKKYFKEISVKVIDEKKSELSITVIFKDDEGQNPLVRGRTLKIRYIIGDLFDFNESFDAIYVKTPGWGGVLSKSLDFWDHIERQLTQSGYLFVDNRRIAHLGDIKLTHLPNNGAFIEKGEEFDASIGTASSFGFVAYQKDHDPAMKTSQRRAASKDKYAMVNGGIDLSQVNRIIQNQDSGQGIKFHIDAAQLAQLQSTPGFVPVIINIQPLKNLSAFLGVS